LLRKELSAFEPEVNGHSLLKMMRAAQYAPVLYQALQTGIFDALDETPRSTLFLAGATGYRPERMVFLLDALTSLGLVEKTGGKYAKSPVAATYLSRNSRFYLGDLINMTLAPEKNRPWQTLRSWLQGDTKEEDVSHNPATVFNPSFVRAMAQEVLCNHKGFNETVALVAGHRGFKSARKLIDLGGGHGLFAIALKQIKPGLEAVVFDLPHVEPVTREYARRYATKIGFHPGNFYKDELPPNQDLILTFDILHPVPPAQKEAVFAKVQRALKPGGYLFYKLWFLNSERTNPRRAALFALSIKLNNHDSHVYTLHEAEEMLHRTGLQVEDTADAGDGTSTIIIARKEW